MAGVLKTFRVNNRMNMEEKNEQIIETADALREDIRRIEHEQRKMFCKGIALGGLTTLAL